MKSLLDMDATVKENLRETGKQTNQINQLKKAVREMAKYFQSLWIILNVLQSVYKFKVYQIGSSSVNHPSVF